MNEQNAEQKQDTGTCDSGCSCGTTGSGGRGRWIAGTIVLAVAGALVARAVVKDNSISSARTRAGFAALPVSEQTAKPDAVVTSVVPEAVKEITALSELNAVAGNTAGVFVFLPGKTEAGADAPMAIMRRAVHTIEPQLRGGKIGLFTLKVGSKDYEQVASQTSMPSVLAMAKGGSMVPVSGDITETKLVQGFVAASNTGGCGSGVCGSGGCK